MSQGWACVAIHRHLIEWHKLNNVSKQKPEIINLVNVPVARWSKVEQEYADSMIQQHFDEDRSLLEAQSPTGSRRVGRFCFNQAEEAQGVCADLNWPTHNAESSTRSKMSDNA